uniref:SPIN-DOC-like zinc-finger domain-containing protein n=1 Tax=Maylandia zebra TaxID=106582 RepID=A0A3P9DNK1_9CICH
SPKMAKTKNENRSFLDRWETEYLFTYVKDRPVCLVCGAHVALTKEYNIRRHYETKHQEKYKDLDMTQRRRKAEEMKRSFVSQQTMFKKAISQSEAAVKASFVVAAEIAKSARPFSEGEFVKSCMMKVCDVVCPEKKQAFSNVSLSRNTVMVHQCGQRSGLVGRVREKMRAENCAGELTVYHCIIHQESLCGKALKMEHVMTAVTRVINFIRAKGLNHRQFKSFLEECGSEDVPYHTEVRWLSRGKVLNRCFELREEIFQFLESKGQDTAELREQEFLCELAFMCDITSHLDALNLQLQGRGRIITDMYAAVRAFKTKLCLWQNQMLQGNLGHFPCCQTMNMQISTAVFPCVQFAEKLCVLSTVFTRRFADFDAQKCRFELLSNPFAVDVAKAPTNLQMELIELQCSDTLKSKYDAVGASQFPHFIPDTMPGLRTHAAQMLSMFGSTYLCEQLFSSMKMAKTSHRRRLTDEHLHSILRISSAQSLSPDIEELASKKRCQAINACVKSQSEDR